MDIGHISKIIVGALLIYVFGAFLYVFSENILPRGTIGSISKLEVSCYQDGDLVYYYHGQVDEIFRNADQNWVRHESLDGALIGKFIGRCSYRGLVPTEPRMDNFNNIKYISKGEG